MPLLESQADRKTRKGNGSIQRGAHDKVLRCLRARLLVDMKRPSLPSRDRCRPPVKKRPALCYFKKRNQSLTQCPERGDRTRTGIMSSKPEAECRRPKRQFVKQRRGMNSPPCVMASTGSLMANCLCPCPARSPATYNLPLCNFSMMRFEGSAESPAAFLGAEARTENVLLMRRSRPFARVLTSIVNHTGGLSKRKNSIEPCFLPWRSSHFS